MKKNEGTYFWNWDHGKNPDPELRHVHQYWIPKPILWGFMGFNTFVPVRIIVVAIYIRLSLSLA